ncbi:amidohydrolase [Streptomyces zagrosensis]|uniref:Amidohydrolase 3 domain-containing protein n=1 Tax=Streptomyces zagrosensis TaxID=1042984 RepID=A0A7W9V1Y9_9ACTN|nr:amidohydrolase [Streptomyces zagrosensis]MBB5938746.1 hypothetical protein [Streptomyces zagrosensis]
MCDACCPIPPGPRLGRAQFLKLIGAGAAAATLSGTALAGTAAAAPRGAAGGGGGPLLVDNVRGYTIDRRGRLRRFSRMLVTPGGRVAAIDPGAARGVRRLDGRGRVLLPGLHDAHGHLWGIGALAVQLDVSGTRSLQEALNRLAAYATAHPEQTWIQGRGWNEVIWGLGRLPTARDLDSVVSDRPVWLVRVDGHAGVANSKALELSGVTANTPDPSGGQIVRDASGAPTGVFVDTAKTFVTSLLPEPTLDDVQARALAAQTRLNAVGLTSVSEAGTSADGVVVLRRLASRGELTLRLNAFLDYEAFTEVGADARTDSFAKDMLRVRTVKLYIDGALGSHGAALIEPYSDRPSTKGLLIMEPAELNRRVERILRGGYQAAVHAIGDLGNRVVLDAYELAFKSVGNRGLRHRIEHAQIIAPHDIPRYKRLGIIASMQPVHATDDMNMAETRLGPDRIKGGYAWRTMLDQGTVVASGSDFPVSSENPFDGLHAAITRTDREGKPTGGWYPEQAMTPVEALRSFTVDAAYAAHQDKVLGGLVPGKWADFILVDTDPFELPAGRALWQTKVLQTWVGGHRVGEYGAL